MKGKKQKEPVGFNPAEIFAALALLEQERGIPQSFMMDKIIQALTTAYKRDHKDVENVIVDVDEEHQRLKMYVQKNVVAEEDYVDPFNEIPVEEAKTISARYEIGDVVNIPGIGDVTILANGDLVEGQETAPENNGVVLLPERVVFTAENVADYPF